MTQLVEPTDRRRSTDTTAPARAPRRRVGGVVAGVALVVGAVVMIGAGAYGAIVRSDGQYVDLGAHGDYRTDGYALTTDAIDWRDTLFGFAGSVRVQVASADDEPIFVGVAAPGELRRYLAGVDFTRLHERDGHVVRSDHDGASPMVPAADAIAWTTYAAGTATQTVRWDATDDRQVVVAMHVDGSRPVHVRIVSSAVTLDRMPWWLPSGAVALGAALLASGVILIRRTVRRPLIRSSTWRTP
jgi:hypothetical protein